MIFDRHILQLHANQQGIFGRASLCLCIEPTSFPCGYDVPQRESTGMECFSVLFPAKKRVHVLDGQEFRVIDLNFYS